MVQRGERKGPCAHPGCKMPHGTIKTQWTFIPESFQGWEDLAEDHNNCVCRLRECRDFVGLPSLSVPAKRQAVAEGIAVQPAVPRPQFVRQIDEIWGVRCACGAVRPPFLL